jgi:ATP-dependent Lon protease
MPDQLSDPKDMEFKTAYEDFRNASLDYVRKDEDIPGEAEFAIQNITNDVVKINFVCSSMPFSVSDKIKLLACDSTKERLFEVLRYLHRDIQFMMLKQDIRSRTREDLDEQQREYFLQQQIKNIKEELGNGEGSPERKELLEKASTRK